MSYFYLDASALVKQYLAEVGSQWIRSLVDPKVGNTIVIAVVTRVEVAAAFAARHRMPDGISRSYRDNAVNLLLQHCNTHYQIVSLNSAIVSDAVFLTQSHLLRGYDAVQLASALEAHRVLSAAGLAGLTFVTADSDLLAAARAEGLAVDNPNLHP